MVCATIIWRSAACRSNGSTAGRSLLITETMAINKRDYYEVLGVVRTATEQDLKSAYRRLAHQYHPDKNQGDAGSEEKFKEAAEAYAVLSDPEQRQRYDRFGHAGVSSAAGAAWGAPGFGNIEDILGDLFGVGDVFAGRRTRSRGSSAQSA